MKALITLEFKALRNPGDRKNSTIEADEVIEGPLAKWAIENGHGIEAPDEAPIGKHPGATEQVTGKSGKGNRKRKDGEGGEA